MYTTYEARKFKLPKLEGISEKSVEEHIGLYEGYVKNFNAISSALEDLVKDPEKNAQALSELVRRRSFEFGGMRLHEHYFTQWEGGGKELDPKGALAKPFAKDAGSAETVIKQVRSVGLMRGPGWSLLYYDKEAHAFLLDYGAQGKGKYIDAFFKNLNWGVVENRFAQIQT